MNSEWGIMVEFGSAGGKISLYGKMIDDNKWKFKLTTQENALIDIIDQEDLEIFNTETKSVDGWSEAFELISKYPWMRMYPLKIHPVFRQIIWDKINNSDEFIDCHPKWYMLCHDID